VETPTGLFYRPKVAYGAFGGVDVSV